jgi:Na+-driven multidrug efflux pump
MQCREPGLGTQPLHGMLMLFRRLLVLAALMFWQGGFTFYAAVVVPVGQEELGSHLQQGFITRQVTNYLNLSGAAALMLLAWDVWASRDGDRARRYLRWAAWVGMLVSLIALVTLHRQLEQLLDMELRELVDPKAFRTGHRWYLWLSTVQWALGLTYVVCTLAAWRAEDQIEAKSGE